MLIFEQSHTGRRALAQAPMQSADTSDIPASMLRTDEPGLPSTSEMQVVRHYTRPAGFLHHEIQSPGL